MAMDGQAQACLVEREGAAAVVEEEQEQEEQEEETASAAAAQSDALCPRGNPTRIYSCSSQRACSSSVGKLSRQRLPG